MRGLEVVSFGVSAIDTSEEDQRLIKDLQKAAVMRDPTMAAATMVGAQADAMRAAATNESGAMMGFMGLGMAQQAGGVNAQNLFAMGQSQSGQGEAAQTEAVGWTCSCGAAGNRGKFCENCGKAKPETDSWTCSCGTVNTKKFCSECGKAKQEVSPGAKLRCAHCGWTSDEGNEKQPKFCPECGEAFDSPPTSTVL
jgi:membrane protease subunit (stomatin/prohibitin family)